MEIVGDASLVSPVSTPMPVDAKNLCDYRYNPQYNKKSKKNKTKSL